MRRTLGILFFAAPFIAAAIGAASARHDFRLAAMAVVATLTARLLLGTSRASFARVAVAFAVATVIDVATAMVAGARAPFGIIAVAVVIAAFATIGQLLLRSEPAAAYS